MSPPRLPEISKSSAAAPMSRKMYEQLERQNMRLRLHLRIRDLLCALNSSDLSDLNKKQIEGAETVLANVFELDNAEV